MTAKESVMVDRVAKAAANAYFGEDCWDHLTEEVFDQWLEIARVTIRAMSEPTDAMVEAGSDAPIINYDGNDPRTVWSLMISAALTP